MNSDNYFQVPATPGWSVVLDADPAFRIRARVRDAYGAERGVMTCADDGTLVLTFDAGPVQTLTVPTTVFEAEVLARMTVHADGRIDECDTLGEWAYDVATVRTPAATIMRAVSA